MQIEHFIQKGLSPKNLPVRLISMNILNNTVCKYQKFPVPPPTHFANGKLKHWVCSIFPTYNVYIDK